MYSSLYTSKDKQTHTGRGLYIVCSLASAAQHKIIVMLSEEGRLQNGIGEEEKNQWERKRRDT